MTHQRRAVRTARQHFFHSCASDSVPPPPPSPPPPPPEPPKEEGSTKRTYSDNWSGAGRFADDEPLPLSFWLLGPNPRRALLPTLLIWGLIAPTTNLWGSGSFLLSLAPEAARQQRLDTFYPVSNRRLYPYSTGTLNYGPGFKRYYDDSGRFEFRYPATYVSDRAVYLRNADAAYNRRMLATTGLSSSPRNKPRGPEVAFGPADNTRDENLSVVEGALAPGFSLRGTLGPPSEAAERLLRETIARQPVVEATTLLSASERVSARSGLPLYQFEYRVDYVSAQQPPSYTVCVVGASGDILYTFASRVPASVWAERANDLREAAASFVLY